MAQRAQILSEAPPIRAVLSSVDDLPTDKLDAWAALVDRAAPVASPYLSPAFAQAVAAVRPGARVALFYAGNRLIAALAFQSIWTGSLALGLGEKIGGHLSDFASPVVDPDWDLSVEDLLSPARLRVLQLDHVPDPALLAGADLEHHDQGVRCLIGPDGAAFLERAKQTSKNHPINVRRAERKATARFGPLTFEWDVVDQAARTRTIDRIIALKRAQYERTNVPDALGAEWCRALLYELDRRKAPGCTPVVSRLSAGDTPLAYHYGLRSDGVLHYAFPTHEPDHKDLIPGHILLRRLFEASPEKGIHTVDLGAGMHDYKLKHPHEVYPVYKAVLRQGGLASLPARAALSAHWRLSSH